MLPDPPTRASVNAELHLFDRRCVPAPPPLRDWAPQLLRLSFAAKADDVRRELRVMQVLFVALPAMQLHQLTVFGRSRTLFGLGTILDRRGQPLSAGAMLAAINAYDIVDPRVKVDLAHDAAPLAQISVQMDMLDDDLDLGRIQVWARLA